MPRPASTTHSPRSPADVSAATDAEIPSWIVGLAGVAAVASLLFTALLLLNL
jgi:hypothetical protein